MNFIKILRNQNMIKFFKLIILIMINLINKKVIN
jgi:hypothetical protein